MNYYERHIGDYIKQTAHLSLLEHGIYNRLLDLYYTFEEAPLDAKVARLVGAKSREEKESLKVVLEEFFDLREDGRWHKDRCDEELANFFESQEGAVDEKENTAERQRRSRARRKAIFEQLRVHGEVPPFSTKMEVLEAMLSRVTQRDMSRDPDVTVTPVTCDATATQTPVPRHHTQEEKEDTHSHSTVAVRVVPDQASGHQPTPAGAACQAMRRAGIPDTNPGHPDLLTLIDAGATVVEFAGAAADAVRRGKGFAYAIGALKGQRKEAAKTAQGLHQGPLPQHDDRKARQLQTAALMTGSGRPSTPPDDLDDNPRLLAP